MLIKLATFRGVSEDGDPLVHVFRPGEPLIKVAGSIMPEIQQWLGKYTAVDGKIALLINALGASEYWGQNINGDVFPEQALIHDCRNHPSTAHPIDDFNSKTIPPYGYWTFLNALPYCFPAGTSVVLGDRSRVPIEDIVVGDIVATSVGPKPVSKIMKRMYCGPGVSIRLRGEFNPLVGTEEHPVLVYRREQIHCRCRYSRLGFSTHAEDCRSFRDPIGDPQWLPLREVLPGDYLVLPQPQHGDVEVDPHFAELVGWVASEGYIGKRGLIQFTFSENNEEDLSSVSKCLEENGLHVTTTPRPQYGVTMLSACNATLSAELQTYISGIKDEKRLTGRVLTWSRNSLLRLLGVYIDGDGCVPSRGRNRGQLRIRSSSPQMLRILSDIIRSLGIPATVQWDCEAGDMVSPINGEIYQGNGSGVVSVTPGWAPEITVHSRKHRLFEMTHDCRQKMIGESFLVQVTEKDEIYINEDVFNLEVPGPHDYVAGEVTVHNCHHQNKDPSRAFGKVEAAVWNPGMRRVELVAVLDRALAMQHGAQHIVDRIDAGEYPDVSMGCKVPYDICTICGNKSKTRDDYCSCVKEIGLGRILDDGRRVGVINTYPRFFDISFVFIGADKTAKVMAKLASAPSIPQSVLDADQIYKTACGARDCRDCTKCKVKVAEPLPTNEDERPGSVRRSWVAEKPLNAAETKHFRMGQDEDEERKKKVREEIARTTDNLVFGRWDHQGETSAIRDGILATNMSSYAGEDPYEKISGKKATEEEANRLMNEIGAPKNKYDVNQVRRGIEVEKEHANTGKAWTSVVKGDKEEVDRQATRTGLGHLDEIPDYYTRLDGMESQAKKEAAVDLKRLFEGAKDIKIGPPPVPNRKEYPFVGSINFRGLEVLVENVPGSWRAGKGWKTLMKLPYGEFAKTKGMDGDKLDVYVGPHTECANVYIVHQNKPQTLEYDEDKVMLGFQSAEEAKAAYLAHYDSDKYLRSVTTMSFPLFKKLMIGGKLDNEKVATLHQELEKVAADMKLEDLFDSRVGRRYRDRTWINKETGKTIHKHQSGMPTLEEATKTASVCALGPRELLKVGDTQKWADILKEVGPDKAVGRVSPLLSSAEPCIPHDDLDELAKGDLTRALSTSSLMGMVLKPEEFQRLALPHLGHGDLANVLDRLGAVFQQRNDGEELPMGGPLSTDHFADSIAHRLDPHLEAKSYFGPIVRRRIVKIIIQDVPAQESSKELQSPLLSKVAAAYNWYRREQMKLAMSAPEFIASRPELKTRVLGLEDKDIFQEKLADIGGLSPGRAAAVLGSIPLTLMYSAHLRDQERVGRQLGFMEQMVAGHPWFTSIGVSGVLRELLRMPQAQRLIEQAGEAAKKI